MRESRWRPAVATLALSALSALLPVAAQASTKLDNDKLLPGRAPPCASFAPASASQAILGGAPSALDRIRASQQGGQQGGASDASAASAPTLTLASIVPQARRPLEPASRTPVSLPLPIVTDAANCAVPTEFSKAGFQSGFTDFAGLAVDLDPDAELGTRAIPVRRTRFDDRWDQVRRAPPAALMQAQLGHAQVSAALGERELLQRVNQWVNRRIAYVNDDRNYGTRDHWATADQTLARGKGDCEDFAILKMHMLRAAGVDASRMKLVLLRDLAANADHAFLLVDTRDGKLVLDNMTDRVYGDREAASVRPVLSFSENRRWVHAYRDGAPASPDMIALPASQKSLSVAMNDQRSVRAEPLTFKTGFSK